MPTVSSNPTCFDIDRPTRVCFLNEGGERLQCLQSSVIGAIYFRKKAADYYEKFNVKVCFFSRVNEELSSN